MAISWDTQITNVDINKARADVTFTRNDSGLADPVTFRKTYKNAIIATENRIPLLNSVWAAWQEELSSQSAISVFLENMEQAANSNLDAREN